MALVGQPGVSPKNVPTNQSTTVAVSFLSGVAGLTRASMYYTAPGDTTPHDVPLLVIDDTHMQIATMFGPVAGKASLILYTGANPQAYQDALTFVAPAPPQPPPTITTRSGWLTLGALLLSLDDHDAGYLCTQLDLGYPDVRDVTNNKPDQDGIDDRSRYFGGRVVTANLTAWPGGTTALDDIADLFAPFLQPSARPQLHYHTISANQHTERVITLRPSAFTSPLSVPFKRDMQLQWVAPDPATYDAAQSSASAYVGSTGGGRIYNLTFPKTFPPGGSSSTTGIIHSKGTLPFKPLFRIYGPITNPTFTVTAPGADVRIVVSFTAGFIINAGHWVDVDTKGQTALRDSDPLQSCFSQISWYNSQMRALPAGVDNQLTASGSSTSGITQVTALWQDAYL